MKRLTSIIIAASLFAAPAYAQSVGSNLRLHHPTFDDPDYIKSLFGFATTSALVDETTRAKVAEANAAQRAANLSDLANPPTALKNLLSSLSQSAGQALISNGAGQNYSFATITGGGSDGSSGPIDGRAIGQTTPAPGNFTTLSIGGISLATIATSASASDLTSGTVPAARLPAPTTAAKGGVVSAAAPANQFQTGINTTGAPTFAQPAFSNLSGSVTAAQLPALTGDVSSAAGSASVTVQRINGAAPAAVATSGSASDLTTGTLPAARLPASVTTGPIDARAIGQTTPAAGNFTTLASPSLNAATGQTLIGQGATTNLPYFVNPAPTNGRFYSFGAQVSAGATAAGDKVAIYGAGETGTGTSNVWGGNLLAHWRSGDPAVAVQGLEVDSLNLNKDVPFPMSELHAGVNSSTSGQFKNGAAFFVSSDLSASAWRYGLYARDGSVSDAGMNFGAPNLRGLYVGRQFANGDDGLLLQRRTDSGATGQFLRFVNAANTSNVALMDVAGNFSTTGAVSAPSMNVAGPIAAQNSLLGSATNDGGWLVSSGIAGENQYPIVRPLLALAPVGGRGGVTTVGSRTSDILHVAGQADITFPVARNLLYDDVENDGGLGTWALYNQSDLRSTKVGYHLQQENSVFQTWPTVTKNPFNVNPLGGSTTLRVDCGKGAAAQAGVTANNCSTGIEIVNNTARYVTGILFDAASLATRGNGFSEAIGMAPAQSLAWHYDGSVNAAQWSIVYVPNSDANSVNRRNVLTLGDTQVLSNVALAAPTHRAIPQTYAALTASVPCNSSTEGTFAALTDATSFSFGATAAGGGSNHVPVYCDGTKYIVH